MNVIVGPVYELGIDSEKVASFYADNWVRKIALAKQQFYDWQFIAPPASNGRDCCVVAYDRDTLKVVGVMGLNPRPFLLNDNQLNGAELTTWIVAKDYLGSGVGAKILSRVQHDYQILIGMGISDMALPVYLKSGFRFMSAIPRFVKVFDFNAIAPYAEMTALARKIDQRWSRGSLRVPYEVQKEPWFDSEEWFNNLAKSYNLFARDVAHITWRYNHHPVFDYQCFYIKVKDGGERALVVLRVENIIEGLCIVHVIDCIGDDRGIAVATDFIEDYCREQNVHIVDFYCTSTRVNRHFLGNGWFSILDDTYFKFPHLFHPIEMRIPATTSLIYWSNIDFAGLCDFSRFYVTKQDADFDRPVLTK